MRRRWALTLVTALALVLAACAGGSDDATPPTTTSTTGFAVPTTTTTAPAAGRTTNLPATGLTECFDDHTTINCPDEDGAFALQDGQVRAGGPLGYTDEGAGTVTDDVTGLVWQRDPAPSTWAEAEADAVAADTGGRDDWRVPTVTELWSLLDLGVEDGTGAGEDAPLLDPDAFALGAAGSRYLTATESAPSTGTGAPSYFVVDFATGRTTTVRETAAGATRPLALRLVRGGDGYGEQDLTGNGDGTITDEATGLTWLQPDSGDRAFAGAVAGTATGDGTLDWEEALAFCADLDVAGIDGWRLPNAKELQSLVDETRVATGGAPVLDPLFATTAPGDDADEAFAGAAWTSTSAGPTTADVVQFGRVLAPDDDPPTRSRVPGAVRAAPKAGEGSPRLPARCVSGGEVAGGAGVSPL